MARFGERRVSFAAWVRNGRRRSRLGRQERSEARYVMPMFASAGIGFVHTPKAAGTSLSHALYGTFVPHVSAWALRTYDPQVWDAVPTFSVVRNPWDRLLSAYRFAIAGGGQGEGAVRIVNAEAYRGDDFASFERFVLGWLSDQDLATADVVFRPQAPWLCGLDGALLVEHVGRMEDMPSLAKHVSGLLGRPISIPRLNTTAPPDGDWRAAYTAETRRRVARIYAEDIERFGYSFSDV